MHKELATVTVVVAAVLYRRGRVYVQKRRSKGPLKGLWEFPGGKVKSGESLRQALDREVQEETGLDLSGHPVIWTLSESHTYSKKSIRIHFFCLPWMGKSPIQNGTWLPIQTLSAAAFPAANRKLLSTLKKWCAVQS